MNRTAFVLASASPRRRKLLRQLGFDPEVIAVEIDENWSGGESPSEYAQRLAREKARAVAATRSADDPAVILAADTVVVIDGQVLGKPQDQAEALEMLAQLSGEQHVVITAVAIVSGEELLEAISETCVWFRDLSEDECRAYWESGEPRDKAGAYAIQGAAAAFVTRIDGSYSGVVGLPLYETADLLARAGLTLHFPIDRVRDD